MNDETTLKKLGPPLVLFFIGLYFWWFETNPTEPRKSGESIPSQILTTWTIGNSKLTFYKGSSGDEVEGFQFNPKSNYTYAMLKGRYKDSVLSGDWFMPKSGQKCAYKKFGTFYWGRFNFDFDKDSFAGRYGYCNDTLDGEWGGAERHFLHK